MCDVKLLEMIKYEIFTCLSKKVHLHFTTITTKYYGCCKVVIYNHAFCWLLYSVKFDCNYIQSYVPCIICGILFVRVVCKRKRV